MCIRDRLNNNKMFHTHLKSFFLFANYNRFTYRCYKWYHMTIHSHPKKFGFGFWVRVSYPHPKPKNVGYETQTHETQKIWVWNPKPKPKTQIFWVWYPNKNPRVWLHTHFFWVLGMGLGFIPKIVGFHEFGFEFHTQNFWVLGVGMKPKPKFFWVWMYARY